MERVCSLTNKIYREMLCITRHEKMTYITIHGLDHDQVNALSWNLQYRIVLCWDFLAWILSKDGRIPRSFSNFITTPELSGALYISPDIYHAQITEYFLEKIQQLVFFFSASNIFLIFIVIVTPLTLSFRMRAFGNTFPVLFQLKGFFIYSDQFL